MQQGDDRSEDCLDSSPARVDMPDKDTARDLSDDPQDLPE